MHRDRFTMMEETFVEAIRAYNPQVVGLSALLTTTLPMVRETIGKIE